MNSSSLLNMAIRVAEYEKNDNLVIDLLRAKQNEARRLYLESIAERILSEVPNATA